MPTYNYRCSKGHITERRCSISARDADPNPPCPYEIPFEDQKEAPLHPAYRSGGSDTYIRRCGAPTTQVFLSAPSINDTNVMIMAYKTNDGQSSRRLMAGHIHAYVDPGVKKVSVGAGGALNPPTKERHPAANWVKPEWKRDVRKQQT
jgi:hypothetical protein